MKITWFGESGFCIESAGKSLLIDPYFSDSLAENNPKVHRLVPADPAWFEKHYDYLLFTHCHGDHTDPQTVKLLQEKNPHLVMAGPRSSLSLLPFANVFTEIRAEQLAQFGPFAVEALPAVHSDRWAMGYAIRCEEKTLYFSGDTALLCNLQDRVPKEADLAFLCFNAGIGKNMNEEDAIRLAGLIRPRCVVPFHYGLLFPEVQPDKFLALAEREKIPTRRPAIGETMTL